MAFTFTQLAGDKKSLVLDGYAAPFGRARKHAIFTEVIDCTIQTTVYPGSKGSPTRHIFSSHWEPMELTGRWMTRWLPGTIVADLFARQWTEFVRDQQPIQMAWGKIASYTGFIQRLELARESEHDIAWKMTVLVDQRDEMENAWAVKQTNDILRNVSDFADAYNAISTSITRLELDFQPDFFEQLENLIANLRSYTKILNDAAYQFTTLSSRTFAVIQSFRGIIKNVESAFAELRLAVLNTEIDAALAVRRASADIRYWTFQNELDVRTLEGLATLKDMERRAAIEERSANRDAKLVQAQDGDSWEHLAFRAGIGISGAASLREANGIRFGELPQAGELYVVP